MDITLIAFGLLALLFSGILHEQMHARVAYWLGDPTGKNDDRFSWNPIVHLDPWMSVVLPLILIISTRGRFIFGGMKPVQINPMNFDNPPLGMAISAAAGPLTNFVLAAFGVLLLALAYAVAPQFLYDEARQGITFNGLFLCVFVFTNMLLGAFNLLPLPGLDGSRILYYFLPRGGRALMDQIEPYAMLITIAAVYFGAGAVLRPLRMLTVDLLVWATGPEFVLAMAQRMWGWR